MKIDNLYQQFNIKGTEQVSQFQNDTERFNRQKVPSEAALEDKIEISQTSKEMRKIEKVIEKTPDVRAEKVKALKEQIESGTYEINPKKIANAMIADLLKDVI